MISIIAVIIIKRNSNEDDYISQNDYCRPSFKEQYVVGRWKYYGYGTETPPYIIFSENKQFVLYDWVDSGYSIDGKWELVGDNEAIKLKFSELDSSWEDLFEDDLYEHFD